MSSYHTASEQALADIALSMHEGAEGDKVDVLVGGLGLGYTAERVLASDRVRRLEVVEYLPQVIAWLEQGLVPLSAELCSDKRLALRQGDVYALLADAPETTWDIIVIDVDHSPDDRLDEDGDAASQHFYTAAGLAAAKAHLAPGGVLGVWSYAESSPFADALRETFTEVRVEEISFDNLLLDEVETDWLFFAY